jgi:very-short-patch-repair endonuclease
MAERSIQRARALRRALTRAESVLWTALRARRTGARLRRQHPIGPYVADFCCVPLRLVVEIDGGSHFEDGAKEHDERRTRFLEACGYEVLRFTNDDVLDRTHDVVDAIARAVRQRQASSRH